MERYLDGMYVIFACKMPWPIHRIAVRNWTRKCWREITHQPATSRRNAMASKERAPRKLWWGIFDKGELVAVKPTKDAAEQWQFDFDSWGKSTIRKVRIEVAP